MADLNDFTREETCEYKGEVYRVRDNGAVMRLTPEGRTPRRIDNIWTFGKPNDKTGYMDIGGQRVHRIVACAFHGNPPTEQHVVDHIDTNRRNNRPENLHWVTRLENALNNPITRARIENICGSIEVFLANPSVLRGHERIDPNFMWMRAVSPEEAQASLARLLEWAKERPESKGGKIGEWIYENGETSSSQIVTPVEDKKKNKEKKQKTEQEIQEVKERAKRIRDNRKKLMELIIAISRSHGWDVDKDVKGNGWKADLVVQSTDCRIGFYLYKSNRDIMKQHEAMNEDGIKGCWLACGQPRWNFGDLLPCFPVEIKDSIYNVEVSEKNFIPVEELLCTMMDDRLQIEENVTTKKVKVRFFPMRCYFCGTVQYLYFINGIVHDEFPSLSSSIDIIDEFDPKVVNAVKKYLREHPELNYPMGEIKERYSKTRDEKYMSFGCPKCDGLVGSFYYSDYICNLIYEPDDEFVHLIELDGEGIQIKHPHWSILY